MKDKNLRKQLRSTMEKTSQRPQVWVRLSPGLKFGARTLRGREEWAPTVRCPGPPSLGPSFAISYNILRRLAAEEYVGDGFIGEADRAWVPETMKLNMKRKRRRRRRRRRRGGAVTGLASLAIFVAGVTGCRIEEMVAA